MSHELPPEALQQIIDDHVAKLLEHFDSVTILVTDHRGAEDDTICYEGGGGNLYARKGIVQEWLTTQDQYARNWAMPKRGKAK